MNSGIAEGGRSDKLQVTSYKVAVGGGGINKDGNFGTRIERITADWRGSDFRHKLNPCKSY